MSREETLAALVAAVTSGAPPDQQGLAAGVVQQAMTEAFAFSDNVASMARNLRRIADALDRQTPFLVGSIVKEPNL